MRPIPADEFSRLVGSIYDCALDPALWPDTLDALCAAMDFRIAVLALQETRTRRVLLDVNVGPQDLERMRDGAADMIEQWGGRERMMSLPLEVPTGPSQTNPDAHRSRFSRECGLFQRTPDQARDGARHVILVTRADLGDHADVVLSRAFGAGRDQIQFKGAAAVVRSVASSPRRRATRTTARCCVRTTSPTGRIPCRRSTRTMTDLADPRPTRTTTSSWCWMRPCHSTGSC